MKPVFVSLLLATACSAAACNFGATDQPKFDDPGLGPISQSAAGGAGSTTAGPATSTVTSTVSGSSNSGTGVGGATGSTTTGTTSSGSTTTSGAGGATGSTSTGA